MQLKVLLVRIGMAGIQLTLMVAGITLVRVVTLLLLLALVILQLKDGFIEQEMLEVME